MKLQQYLKRIHYSGSLSPSYEVLKSLQQAHLFHVPFENLDIHLGKPVVLDTDKMYDKIVENNRGGFCYELNGLFYELLTALGFKAKMVSGSTLDKKTGTYGREFDHLALIVDIDGNAFLSDVGFGEFTQAPLKMETEVVQRDAAGDFIMDMMENGYYRIRKLSEGQLQPEYIFTPRERQLHDFEAMCRYQQTSPESHFTKKRLITLPTKNGRITITGNTLKIRAGKSITETPITDEEAYHNYLLKYFNVRLDQRNI